MSNIATFHANYQSFWHNGHGRGKQKGVWISGGAGRAGGAPLLTQHEYVLKTTTYQNNNSEGWSWSLWHSWPKLAHDAEVYNVMMIAFYQDVAKLESEDNFSLQRVAWVCSSLTSERFFVCGWFRCWLSWAIVSGSEWSWWTQASSQELHYISPPAAEGDDSFTEQNSGFVTTTGHRATRHQAVFATWDVEQWFGFSEISGSVWSDGEASLQTDHVLIVSTHCHRRRVMSAGSTRHQTGLLHNTEYRAGPAVASYFIQ